MSDSPAAGDVTDAVEAGALEPVRRGVGRRAFLSLVGLGAGATVVAGVLGKAAQQTVSRVLPTGRFRIYTVTDSLPTASLADWRLAVAGDVDSPLSLDYGSLRGLGTVDETSDFHCVTGWSVYDCVWSGVPLATVLDAAGASSTDGAVAFASFDGAYTESLTMEQARRPENLIATHLGGEPLSQAQGYPARVIVPSMYGYKGTKWVSEITVTDSADPGYWEVRGYDQDGWVGASNGYKST
ncbi:MAG: molybdopterin-dependent oxidoreductase [Acidimicrobiia bacterium]|nr:molybdopterin-dependent oxidoreductase [Acidimicrobiia bacterium]